ncbi:MAG: beta-ketoacyl-[acyl-carrier-protein] synthase family protein [Gemmatimonadaceae bacterium]
MRADAERDVVITGLGAVCALGEDCNTLWTAIVERRSGIAPIERFDTEKFQVRLGAMVASCAEAQPATRELTGRLSRKFARQALREALVSAGFEKGIPEAGRPRIALVLGTGIADRDALVHTITEDVAEGFNLDGPRLTISTACSSSTAAIGLARDLLAMHAADIVVAGGADVLTPEVFAGFHALGVLSDGPCAPFSTPAGTTLGEGAGFIVLERHDDAVHRGATVRAHLSGYGLSADAWHETSPDPVGAGVERAIHASLRDAGVAADAVGYVNVHGSGTEANDRSEWLGIQRTLCLRGRDIPVSSTKGALGHAQGAAGVLETIVTLLAMRYGSVPPTLNFTKGRPQSPPDPVVGPEARVSSWGHALKLSSAFGGSNASLLLSRECGERPALTRRRVSVLGIGEVGPGGFGAQAFPCARDNDVERPRRVGRFDLEAILPSADPRGLDPASRFLTAAAALALDDAGIGIRGPLRDRAGLLVGQLRGSATSIDAFQRSIDERGLAGLSPTAFARIVLNAATGFCSKLLSLRGPLSAITTGAGSSLAAVVMAAELLATRTDTDLVVAGGCDEHLANSPTNIDAYDEGASCVVLANERGLAFAKPEERIWLSGWALAGPGRVAEAVECATANETVPKSLTVFRAEDMPAGAATSGTVALAAAIRAIRRGATTHALVTSGSGNSISAALLLTAPTAAA